MKAPDQAVSRAFTTIHKQLKNVKNMVKVINVNTELEPGRKALLLKNDQKEKNLANKL